MNYKNKSEAYDNSESLSIWEGLHIIVSRWKLLLIITVIFCITGFIASLLTDKFHSYTAAYNIDTSDSTYYANNFITELEGGEFHFNLETVAFRSYPVGPDIFNNLLPVADETCCCVHYLHTGYQPYINRSKVRHEHPRERPVDNIDTAYIPRSDRHISAVTVACIE